MGIWLLAIESLFLALLWVATGLAWRAKRQRFMTLVCTAMFLLPLLFYSSLLAGYLNLRTQVELSPQLPAALALLLGGYLLGTFVLWRKARRMVPSEGTESAVATVTSARQAASRWPAGKLASATLLALVLHAMTFWNLDTAVRHRLEALRVEAGAKALAVAPGKPADRENAALYYEQAFALLPKNDGWPKQFISEWTNQEYIAEHPDVYEDPALQKFLQSQAQTLALLHQAAALPACSFDRNYAEPRIDMLIPEVSSMRDAMRILLLQSHVSAAQGNLLAAVQDAQTAFMMGEHVAADPLLISMLVSLALDAAAIDTLQSILSEQQPTIAELAPLSFGPPQATSRRLSRAFRMEEAFGLATFGQMATQSNMWAMFGAISTEEPPKSAYLGALAPVLALYRVLLLEDDVAAYRKLLGEYQALAPLSPAAARHKFGANHRQTNDDIRGLLTSMFVPAIDSCLLAAGRHAARYETMQAGIAVHRYRAEQGELPNQLADLVPQYLAKVPLDPYDDQPLKWKISGDDWVVYSIGEDLKDEGGAPYKNLDRTGDIGFYAVEPPQPVVPNEKQEHVAEEMSVDTAEETPPKQEKVPTQKATAETPEGEPPEPDEDASATTAD